MFCRYLGRPEETVEYMQRNLVQVARIRLEEVVPGDVVNRLADEPRGWFIVGIIEQLFDGDLMISDASRKDSFSAAPLDFYGVQTLKPMNIPVTAEVPEIVGDALVDKDPEEAEPQAA